MQNTIGQKHAVEAVSTQSKFRKSNVDSTYSTLDSMLPNVKIENISSMSTLNHTMPKNQLQTVLLDLLPSGNGPALCATKIMNQHLMLEGNMKIKKPLSFGKKSDKKKMSARCAKDSGLFEISKSLTYEQVLPLNELWKKYMLDVLGDFRNMDENKILKADFHGANMTVVQSKCPHYVGTSGILIQETMHVFKIMTLNGLKSMQLKFIITYDIAIPKANSIFSISFDTSEVVIYGNQFVMRTAERTVRKFKYKNTIQL